MAEVDCPHTKRMIVNNVPYCLQCAQYLYSGLCPKCGRALDDHRGIGTPEQACPKDEGVA